jgi:hypothetical protein
MIGAFLPSIREFQRGSADFEDACFATLADQSHCVSVTQVDGSATSLLNPQNDHTPSPQGQCGFAPRALPLFRKFCGWGLIASPMEPKNEPCVGLYNESSKGTSTCPSNTSYPASSCVAALQLAAIRLANRHSAAASSGRGLRRSPAGRLRKVRPSVRPAMSLTANSIPADANTLTYPRRYFVCAARFLNPAQHPLSQGFRAYTKTQEDIPCSTKS